MYRTFRRFFIPIAIVLLLLSIPAIMSVCSRGTVASAQSADSDISPVEPSPRAEDRMKDTIVMYIGSPVAIVNGNETSIDPSDAEIAPVIKDDVRMVPLRFIAESLGAEVKWDAAAKKAIVDINSRTFQFEPGSSVLQRDNASFSLGTPVRIINGRIFVPLEKLTELLDKNAFYDRGLIIISSSEFDSVKDHDTISGLISRVSYLPVVGSYDKLKALLEEAVQSSQGYFGGIRGRTMKSAADTAAVESSAQAEMKNEKTSQAPVADDAGTANTGTQTDYSTTNVQVQGVDEADIVKTDGQYIYQVNRQRVAVVKAYPAADMKVLSMLSFKDVNFNPQELYLHDSKLIVIGSTLRNRIPAVNESEAKEKRIVLPYHNQQVTKILIYDASDKYELKPDREIEIEGGYVSSRKIGSSMYLVSNRYVDYYRIMQEEKEDIPFYRDTLKGDEYIDIDFEKIHYFPGSPEVNYMIVAGIDLEGEKTVDINTFLGAGQNIYASTDHLYVAITSWKAEVQPLAEPKPGISIIVPDREQNTRIYKFALKGAQVTYLCKGEVPGTVLNQFSMDENKNHFRIATTRGNVWGSGEQISKNNLYILDDLLSIKGSIEDIAPGEKIYSVRFMGDRAYMVTFRTIDPLFVLDLENPEKPAVLGALKIPGYSDYLHPYDENHIIGFGKDTVEKKGQAYYLGMKLALFDVSDVTNPVQKFSTTIGDRGTDSELLRDHKALLFSKDKNLLAFPVTVMEIEGMTEEMKRESLQHGQFTFQGAYVYSLDPVNGFKLRDRITHISEPEYLKAGSRWYDSGLNIQRILYIDDTLYTLSQGMIKANGLEDLKERNYVLIP